MTGNLMVLCKSYIVGTREGSIYLRSCSLFESPLSSLEQLILHLSPTFNSFNKYLLSIESMLIARAAAVLDFYSSLGIRQ